MGAGGTGHAVRKWGRVLREALEPFVCHGPLLNSVLEVPTECVLGRNMLSITALRFKTKAIFLNTGIERLVAIWALPRDDRGSNKYCYELS